MEGLLSLLLFAALFYFMMRFGCGAHMVHGHGGSHGDHAGHGRHGGGVQAGSDRDPVCGMEVAPGQGYTKTYGGREYRLCSRACLDKFEANPGQYASA
jgi:YHS domain-containing protein